MFVLKKGVGLHIKARKLAKLGEKKAENSLTEEFHVKIEDAFFTNGLGQHVERGNEVLWALILSAEMTRETNVSDTHIVESLVPRGEENFQPAHRALTILLSHFVDENNPLNWRKALLDHQVLVESSILRKAAVDGISQSFVRYVLDLVPEVMPAFLSQ